MQWAILSKVNFVAPWVKMLREKQNCNHNSNSVSLGHCSGVLNQGKSSIAIGDNAGVSYEHKNSIILNASSIDFNSYGES